MKNGQWRRHMGGWWASAPPPPYTFCLLETFFSLEFLNDKQIKLEPPTYDFVAPLMDETVPFYLRIVFG